MSGYLDFHKFFKTKSFVSSKEIASRYNLQKALASNYVFPSFFRGVYYIPSPRERKGRFIEKPSEFFCDLLNFIYGRSKWYWSLTTAARYHGLEWSSNKILEVVTPAKSKTIDIVAKATSLGNKRSYRSKILSQVLFSLGINYLIIHHGKIEFLKETKFDPEIGSVATKTRMLTDIELFLSKTRIKALRNLYRSILKNQNAGWKSERRGVE